MDKAIQKLKDELKQSEAYAAIIFGSYVRDEDFDDIDVAIFTDESVDRIVREVSAVFDIQRFSDLPMYVKHRALKEGELIYCSNEDRFYDETIRFAREYEYFRPRYEDYLEGVKSRG